MRRSWLWALIIVTALIGFVLGRAAVDGTFARFSDGAKDLPLFPAPPKESPETGTGETPQDSDIIVETPVDDAVIVDPMLEVTGRAKAEGGPLRVVIKDAAGTEIAAARVEVYAEGGEFGRFGNTFAFAVRPVGAATVEIGRVSGEGTMIVRRITFSDGSAPVPAPVGEDTVILKAYFHSSTMGSSNDCETVFPVDRVVPTKTAGYRAALEATLKGPTADEKANGFSTAIPVSAALKSVAADAQGIVTADFTDALDRGVAGSCRVLAIRAQIETTLRQFPEVRGVQITVNGRADDVLQP